MADKVLAWTDCCQTEPLPLNIFPMCKVVSLKARLPGPSYRQWRGCLALSLCLLLFVAPPLLADSYYLPPDRPDGIALLAPPPEAGSPEGMADLASRSEERRVGKECRSRWSPY